jgi:hypothetical protein
MEPIKEKSDPTFIEQAFAMIEESYANGNGNGSHGMTIMDHKLLCKILDAHEKYIDEKIIDAFVERISEHYNPIMRVLQDLEKITTQTSLDIQDMKKWQIQTEKRLGVEETKTVEFEKRLQDKKRRIEALEKKEVELEKELKEIKPEVIHEFLEKIECVTPKLDKIIEINQPKTIRRRITKAVIISVLITVLLIDIAFYIHNRVSHNTDNNIPKTEKTK